MRKARVYLALLHYPIYNKRMHVVTTSVTNLDLHDISRAARTYDIDGFFVVHPSPAQKELLSEVLAFWQEGFGVTYNPDRREAFRLLSHKNDLEEVKQAIRDETGMEAITVATDARIYPRSISYRDMRNSITEKEQAVLFLFGTGWGIHKDIMDSCDYILEPLEAGREYNHLSVRSAVSIILDRLLGEHWFK
ncbi:MAG: RNA methyltransferase [Syntrophomonadaceae bacterium]|nr:RNA methyltransferase [Syntrophomonadaceae bacterium]